MTIFWAFVPVLALFSLLAAYRNLAVLRYRLVPPPPEAGAAPGLVSVIIPARDEEAHIRGCLESVLAQTYRPLQVIVVDDNSTDATGRILAEMTAQHSEVEAMQGKPLPPGWVGKNHALSQGVARARGRWLAFLDADTRLGPQALGRAVALARQKGLAMVSFLPHHELGSFWEKAVQPMVLGVALAGAPPSLIEDPKDPTAGAFGQFILFDGSAYGAIGGHQAVRGEVLENWRLAQRVKGQGLPLALAEGQDLATVRMYTSFSGLWEGWSKNTFHGADKKLHLLLAVLAFVFVLGPWPALLVAWAVLAAVLGLPGLPLAAGAGAFQSGLTLYYGARVSRRLGLPAAYALGYPLGGAVFLGILLNSAYRILSGRGVVWKGRTYK